MKMNTTLKILMCTSALAFAGVGTASAHQHEAGEAAASKMKDKAADKAMEVGTEKAKEMMKGETTEKAGGVNDATDAIKDATNAKQSDHKMSDGTMMKGESHSMQEKATDMAMDKAKGMAKEKALGTAGAGMAGQVEHKMKEKAMDHAMDKAGDHAKGMMMKDKAAGADIPAPEVVTAPASDASMPAKAQGVIMETPAIQNAAPASQPAKLLTFDEALSVCRGQAALQACIDEKTGQGALRQQIHNNRPGS